MKKNAFTLVELLVVVAIIALLLGILLPAMAGARQIARQCRGMSDLKQMLTAYTEYQLQNSGDVLLGYTPNVIAGQAVTVSDGGASYGYPVSNRYPWRFVPYLSGAWGVLYSAGNMPDRPQPGDSDSDAFMKAYHLSVNPTFGLNSLYVGGHAGSSRYATTHDGFDSTGRPILGRNVVYRGTEVHQPTQLIVFSETKFRGGGVTSGDDGYFWASPPLGHGRIWHAASGGQWKIDDTASGIGLPEGRYRNKALTGFFDSHVGALTAGELDDMTLWSNTASSADADPLN